MRLVKGLVVALVAVLATAGAAVAQEYDWTNDVPRPLKGTWVKIGERCEESGSRLAIFSDGGYRWRTAPTEWGFARGKYAWTDGSPTVYFRVQRLVQQENPDFQITVTGPEMRKYAFGSGKLVRYEKCPD